MSTTIPYRPGLCSTEIQHAEFSVPGREVIVNRVEIGLEARPIRHGHPGEEIIYVLDGASTARSTAKSRSPFRPARA